MDAYRFLFKKSYLEWKISSDHGNSLKDEKYAARAERHVSRRQHLSAVKLNVEKSKILCSY